MLLLIKTNQNVMYTIYLYLYYINGKDIKKQITFQLCIYINYISKASFY